MNKDLVYIKKHYGEKFAQLCGELFPSILKYPGELSRILDSKFSHNKFLYYDLIKNNKISDFTAYINKLSKYEYIDYNLSDKTPYELLDSVGYTLYKCESEASIQFFRNYYENYYCLSTFNGDRLKTHHVYFAVKKDVDKYELNDFPKPNRQDEYGTSVISIQFSKDEPHALSIINRYIDYVDNIDATFSNNLDNIVEGLTSSFEKELSFEFQSNQIEFSLPNYKEASDGKFYRYYKSYIPYDNEDENNNIYFCINNTIIENNKAKVLDYGLLLVGDCILDLKNKSIKEYINKIGYYNSLADSINSTGKISDISCYKEVDGITKVLINIKGKNYPIKFDIDELGNILMYSNIFAKSVCINFLGYEKYLNDLDILNCETIKDEFLLHNKSLKELYLPMVKIITSKFMCNNHVLEKINLDSVEIIGNEFLIHNNLTSISLPKLESAGKYFMQLSNKLKTIYAPKLEVCKKGFLECNINLEVLSMDNVTILQTNTLYENRKLETLYLPNCTEIWGGVLQHNHIIKKVYLPCAKRISNDFLKSAQSGVEVYIPSTCHFVPKNKNIKIIYTDREVVCVESPNTQFNKRLVRKKVGL